MYACLADFLQVCMCVLTLTLKTKDCPLALCRCEEATLYGMHSLLC